MNILKRHSEKIVIRYCCTKCSYATIGFVHYQQFKGMMAYGSKTYHPNVVPGPIHSSALICVLVQL